MKLPRHRKINRLIFAQENQIPVGVQALGIVKQGPVLGAFAKAVDVRNAEGEFMMMRHNRTPVGIPRRKAQGALKAHTEALNGEGEKP